MIKCVESDETPLCPHCSEPIQVVRFREIPRFLGKTYVYFCSRCRKALGISQRKGYFLD